MKNETKNSGEIYFMDFIFNQRLRTLQQYDDVVRLTNKQSEVLALLCQRYPEPVSSTDFLNEVWGGRYVSQQSIAQIIRVLRSSLGDDSKSIITTISKLGYQLTVQPTWEESEVGFNGYIHKSELQKTNTIDNVYLTKLSGDVYPTISRQKSLSSYTLFLIVVVTLFLSLISVAMNARSNSSDFTKTNTAFFEQPLEWDPQQFYLDCYICCKKDEYIICRPEKDFKFDEYLIMNK